MLERSPEFPDDPVSYDTPGLYTPHLFLSEAGERVVDSIRTLNTIMPLMFISRVMYLYIGFPEDDLYLIYPGIEIGPNYYANSRAWWIGAVEKKGEVFITEPY